MKKIITMFALASSAAFVALTVQAAETSVNGINIDLDANTRPIASQKDEQAAAKIPKNFHFVHPGELTVGVAANGSPPLVIYANDNKTLIGSEPDIARLVASSLGLKLRIVPTSWDDWPLGVTSGKYDAVITNVTVTKERKTKFDFATYRKDLLGFYVANNSPIKSITKAADVAGKKIIVGSGTNQESILLAWNKQNIAAGLPAFTPVYLTDKAAINLAIESGRVDAFFGPNVIGAWTASQTGRIHLVGTVDGGWPKAARIAVTLKKGTGLVDAVAAGINASIAQGTYQKVLNRWGEGIEAIPTSEINPPGLGD